MLTVIVGVSIIFSIFLSSFIVYLVIRKTPPAPIPSPIPSPIPAPKTCNISRINRINVQGCSSDCTVKATCLQNLDSCYEVPPSKESINPTTQDYIPWCYNSMAPNYEGTCDITPFQRVNIDGCDSDCTIKSTCETHDNACYDSKVPTWNYNTNMFVPWCYQTNTKVCKYPTSETTNIMVYNGSCIDAKVGGTGECSKIMGRPLPVLTWGTSKDVKPGEIQYGVDYIQEWNLLSVSGRAVSVAYPTGSPPAGGWPMVYTFDFSTSEGWAQGWPQLQDNNKMIGGIAETLYDGSPIIDDESYGCLSYILYKRHIVHAGYALVCMSEIQYDTEMYLPCSNEVLDNQCWNDGNNKDANALRILFDKIYDGTLINGLKLNTSRFALSGYSVGAQMVSRMINEFPTMKTNNGYPFPTIKAAIMIGGGSFHCYEFYTGTTTTPPPWNYLPCDNSSLGCCPVNQTEDNYDQGVIPWDKHPAMMLLQGKNDVNAAWQAVSNYFGVISDKNVPSYMIIGPVIEDINAGRHGIYDCQIGPTIKFLLSYV